MDELHAFGEIQAELDLYLSFLKKRQELELEYAESLRKLHSKQVELESKIDDEDTKWDPTGWRIAWLEIRNNVKEDAMIHRLLAQKIHKTLASLTSFRDSRDRIRRRIQEDVKNILSEYSDYKSVVLKLKRAYERKIDDAQNFEEQEAEKEREAVAALNNESGVPSSSGGGLLENIQRRNRSGSTASSRFFDTSATTAETSPTATAVAAPSVFISGATATYLYSGRTQFWDPPMAKTSVFDTLAKRDWTGEKNKVNSIVRAVGQLTKASESHPASYSAKTNKMRSKLRRDAEQADCDYRDGIFRLETLRLQRIHVQHSAARSLNEFCADVSHKLRDVFKQHITDLEQTSYTEITLNENVRPVISRINPQFDAHECSKRLPEFPSYEAPLYYVNRFVGECKSLLIGVSLIDYHAQNPDRLVPLLVEKSIARLEVIGLDVEGIYRVPGKLSMIQQIVHRCEKDEASFDYGPKEDAASIAGVLKLYLRQLPTPLFNFSMQDRISWCKEYRSDADTQFGILIRRIRRLPAPHQATLKLLCEHLSRVAKHHTQNKMPPYNLGLIFTPVVFGENDMSDTASLSGASTDMVMEFLILNHKILFENALMDPQIRQLSFPSSKTSPTSIEHLSVAQASTRDISPSSSSSTSNSEIEISPSQLIVAQDLYSQEDSRSFPSSPLEASFAWPSKDADGRLLNFPSNVSQSELRMSNDTDVTLHTIHSPTSGGAPGTGGNVLPTGSALSSSTNLSEGVATPYTPTVLRRANIPRKSSIMKYSSGGVQSGSKGGSPGFQGGSPGLHGESPALLGGSPSLHGGSPGLYGASALLQGHSSSQSPPTLHLPARQSQSRPRGIISPINTSQLSSSQTGSNSPGSSNSFSTESRDPSPVEETPTALTSHHISISGLGEGQLGHLSIPYDVLTPGSTSTDSVASTSTASIVARPERRSSVTPAPRTASSGRRPLSTTPNAPLLSNPPLRRTQSQSSHTTPPIPGSTPQPQPPQISTRLQGSLPAIEESLSPEGLFPIPQNNTAETHTAK